jgi:ABC-type amino acid transport substrate-binding protein
MNFFQTDVVIFLLILFQLNVNAITLKSVYIQEEPFFMLKKSNITNQNILIGFAPDLMNEITKKLPHIQFEMYESPDGKYGTKYNSEWNGIIGELVNKKANISFSPLTVTSERKKEIFFSDSYLNIGLQFLNKRLTSTFSLNSFLLPFDYSVWISLLGVVFLIGILLWVFDHVSPYGSSKTENNKSDLNFTNSMLSTGIGMTGQLGNPGRSWSTRILTLGYYLFLIIVTSTYTANLASNSYYQSSLKDFYVQSIENIQPGVTIGTINNTMISNLFERGHYSSLLNSLKVFNNSKDLIKALRDSTITTALIDTALVDYYSNLFPCDLIESGVLVDPSNYAIAMPLNSSFSNEISIALLELKDENVISNLYKKWWKDNGIGTCTTSSSSSSLGFSQFGGVFVCLGFVIVGCVLIIIIESIYWLCYQTFGKKFPFLLPVHLFLGGTRDYKEDHENPDEEILSETQKKDYGCNIELNFACQYFIFI